MATKNDIFEEHFKEWLHAKGNKKKRGEMVRHLCFVTGMHRKSIPRSFTRLQMRDPGTPERRGRATYYTPDVIAALKNVWDIAEINRMTDGTGRIPQKWVTRRRPTVLCSPLGG